MYYICTNNKKLALHTDFMSKLFTLMMLLLIGGSSFAQRHELGIRVGGTALVGDIGKTNYLPTSASIHKISEYGIPAYIGALYRMNVNPYQTIRFNLGYANLIFDDDTATEAYRSNRKIYNSNTMLEANALFEYNFAPVNNEQKGMLSPYIFGGFGGIYASFKRKNNNDNEYYFRKKMILSLPFGVGLKYKFNYNWAVSGELMFRPTFSDGLDFSMVYDSNGKTTNDFVGNKNSNDWVNSITLGVSYSFGRPPCYCD